MTVKYYNPLNSAADLTLVQTNATVAVSGNKIVATATSGGDTSWNGAYQSANLVTLAANDRFYFKFQGVNATPYIYVGDKRSPANTVPDGNDSQFGFTANTTLIAWIYATSFSTTPGIDFIASPVYGCYVYGSPGITPYFNQTGHSNNLGSYTSLVGNPSGNEIGQTHGLLFSVLNHANGITTNCYPYAYTDSNGFTPNAPTLSSATSVSQNEIDLTFIDNGSIISEMSLSIEQSLTSGSGFVEIATPAVGSSTYNVTTGLLPATTYYFRMRSYFTFDGINYYSAYSSEKSATTQYPIQPPVPTYPPIVVYDKDVFTAYNDTGWVNFLQTIIE